MAAINQNNCNVSNIKPLEVQCSVTNTTSPDSQDGSIDLQIIGGTAPYTVTWSNNGHGYSISNLGVGCYTATVTDRYQDYTITQTCCVESDNIYLDKFIKCNDFNPNIYVFYDGTSLDADESKVASKQIRNWFETKTNNGFTGKLYEGVIGGSNGISLAETGSLSNGENWLWWSTYPYLGSLTGGTLSDGTVVKAFGRDGESIENSVYLDNVCSSNDNGKCVPRTSSFNNRGIGSNNTTTAQASGDIYYRINSGFDLDSTTYQNDIRSEGVPFSHNLLVAPNDQTNQSIINAQCQTLYGDFTGGDKDYIVIIICDEADGFPAFYTGALGSSNVTESDRDLLFERPFEQINGISSNPSAQFIFDRWDDETLRGPSTRFEGEYESFLKVWEDIKSEGGSLDSYLYPVITNNQASIPFLQHAIAVVEGDTITENEFQTKYGAPINEVPISENNIEINLSALTRTNVYSGLTGTTTYMQLPSQYKNGAGLKNFNWIVEPTAQSYSEIGGLIDEYLDSIQLTDEEIYALAITPTPSETMIYNINELEDCWYYDERLLSSGQDYDTLTLGTSYSDCYECTSTIPRPNPQPLYLCLSNGTNQYEFTSTATSDNGFVWYNDENSLTLSYNESMSRWEVTPWTNVGLGSMVRQNNETVPLGDFINLGNTSPDTWTMTEGRCLGIPLTVSSQVSNETCRGSGNGSVILIGSGGYEPYSFRIQSIPPFPDYSITGIFNNLTPNTNWIGQIIDASGNTSSTIFSIQEGEIAVNYTVSLTSIVTNSGTGTRTWNYGVQVNPSLPSGVSLTFDIVLTHIQQYRDQGTATFSYDHVITKNGSINVPYTTSSETTVTTPTTCQTKPTNDITDTFTDTAYNVTYGNTDTSLNGTVTQTVTINGQGLSCLPDCRMVGIYNTSLQVSNLSISGTECGTVTNAFTPVSENITIYDCDQAQP